MHIYNVWCAVVMTALCARSIFRTKAADLFLLQLPLCLESDAEPNIVTPIES